MRTQAQTVIVGAGIVGVSAAYYLAKGGMTDIVVVDRGPLFQTGGSTSHAPGGILQNNAHRTVSKLAQWSVEMFFELSDEGERTYFSNGSLEIATTPERWTDLHRKAGFARSWGLDAQLLSPLETGELLPQLDTAKILGSIYINRDGTLRSVPTVERLAKRAVALGVKFIGETTVTGFDTTGGRVRAVETDRGRIDCEQALLCGGIWGPELGRMAGISIPLQPCAHPFIRTTPLPELAGTEGIVQPLWRHQDFSMYLWQDGERYGVGSYRHEPVIVDADRIRNNVPAPAELPFDESPLAPGLEEARRLVPALRTAGATDRVYGMFSFTPDGLSLLGESAEVRGLWVAEAVWVTHGIGSGRAIAELMLTGDCELDLRDLDLNRFAKHVPARSYVRQRGWQQYREVYDIIHPRDVLSTPRGLRRTPAYSQQQALGAVFTESNGWERALWYETNASLPTPALGADRDQWSSYSWSPIAGAEHLATRANAGLFDLSTFTVIEVSGPGALDFLGERSCTNLDTAINRMTYALFLNPHGGIESDVTVARLAEDRFLIFAGSASGPRDLAALRRAARDRDDVVVRDFTSSWAGVGLWGPRARAILEQLTAIDRADLDAPSFAIREMFVAGIPCLAVRVSYIGEDGWELHCPTEYGAALWDAVWEAGQPLGLIAIGLAAVDSMRIECGFRALGTDLRAERTPYEAGLGFAVSSKRTDFTGAAALGTCRGETTLTLLELLDPATVVLGNEPVLHDNETAGFVTSAAFGFSVAKSLALAYLPIELSAPGTELEIEYFATRYPARVVAEPLIAPKRA
jgi:glycine cleavage system aminomethyltransferase T/glycine/D-amino acid oxidase-like deaminating enzyme